MAGESPNPIGPAVFCRTTRGRFPGDAETWKDTGVANTVNPFDWCGSETRACELVVENSEIYAIDGDKLGKAERAGGSGWGVAEGDVMYTLSAKDVHGVAICPPAKSDSPVRRFYSSRIPSPAIVIGWRPPPWWQ